MGRPNHAVCRAGARRCTGPRRMAISKRSRNCSCAAPPWLSGTVGGTAALRRTVEPTAQPDACRSTPKQRAEQRGKLAQYEAAETQVYSAACTPPLPATPCLEPHPSPIGIRRRMCRRRLPSVGARRCGGEGGIRPRSTRAVMDMR
jgi:hypothetical protein